MINTFMLARLRVVQFVQKVTAMLQGLSIFHHAAESGPISADGLHVTENEDNSLKVEQTSHELYFRLPFPVSFPNRLMHYILHALAAELVRLARGQKRGHGVPGE